MAKIEQRHRQATHDIATKLHGETGGAIDAWVETGRWQDRAGATMQVCEAVAQAIADAEQRGRQSGPPTTNAEGQKVVWDWPAWGRFIGARAQLIHEWTKEGRSVEEIRRTLSMDATQVQLIAMTPLESISGIPGQVWPPPEFQKPKDGQ